MDPISDQSATYDDSFPIALDENYQTITAVDALKLQKYVSNPVFYCPICYKMDSNKKTRVFPSQRPPLFHLVQGESHLATCQYKHDSIHNIAKQIGIEIDDHIIQLTLMSYDAKDIFNKPLGSKLKRHIQTDHKKFMDLLRYLLMNPNHDMGYFQKKYAKYKLKFQNKTKSLTQIILTLDSPSTNAKLNPEKLHIVIGKIGEISRNDSNIWLKFDHPSVDYDLFVYMDRFFCDFDQLRRYRNQRIACMGYLRKLHDSEIKEAYAIEVLSISHQMVFLDQDINIQSRIQTKELVSFLETLTQNSERIQLADFQRSYYKEKLKQVQSSVQKQIELLTSRLTKSRQKQTQIAAQMEQLKDEQQKIVKKMKATQKEQASFREAKNHVQKRINDVKQTSRKLQEKSTHWWYRLKNFISRKTIPQLKLAIEKQQHQIEEYTRELTHLNQQLRDRKQCQSELQQKLTDLNSTLANIEMKFRDQQVQSRKLANQIKAFKQQLQDILERYESEQQIKKDLALQGDLYAFRLHANWYMILDLSIERRDLYVACQLHSYLIQKVDHYYLPYTLNKESTTWIQRQKVQSNRYTHIKRMTQSIQHKLQESIKHLSKLIQSED